MAHGSRRVTSAQATDLVFDLAPVLGSALLIATLFWVQLRSAWRRRRRRARARAAARRGRTAELDAPEALKRRGYRVLQRHPEGTLDWHLDGELRTAEVAADLLVSRDGCTYVVEVKTGRGTRPTKRETRRQLLEYALAYDVDGVLLFDADADRLHHIEFGPRRPTRSHALLWFIIGAVSGLAAGILLH